MTESKRTLSRVRTRFIAVLALITSGITFGSGFMVFLYMKSAAFENQLVEQVMKHMDWIIVEEFDKKVKELKPLPVVNTNDPNKWFWEYIERRQKEQIEEELNW
tara:strand:- start:535 stop:846 length:312 start_codon:yes stop_codon:yes gene_type:complete